VYKFSLKESYYIYIILPLTIINSKILKAKDLKPLILTSPLVFFIIKYKSKVY
jgi:hypothetical protein